MTMMRRRRTTRRCGVKSPFQKLTGAEKRLFLRPRPDCFLPLLPSCTSQRAPRRNERFLIEVGPFPCTRLFLLLLTTTLPHISTPFPPTPPPLSSPSTSRHWALDRSATWPNSPRSPKPPAQSFRKGTKTFLPEPLAALHRSSSVNRLTFLKFDFKPHPRSRTLVWRIALRVSLKMKVRLRFTREH